MSSKKKLLIIGLDGATWKIIEPWAAQGLLPNFASLMKQAAWNSLLSTVPPATFPAWTTFMTGKNPGKHGIYDFTEKIYGDYSIRFLNATFRKAKSLWKILSEAGLRTAVMGLPATYPPEKLNGFMISGFDSPVASTIDRSFVYPPSLYTDIKEHFGGYTISELQENFMDKFWYEKAYEKILHTLKKKAEIAQYLYKKEPWDCFMVLFGESDTVSHHFWKFFDPASPRHKQGTSKLSNAILNVYQHLDETIGRFLQNLWNHTSVLIVSDHGFGGVGDRALSINHWLLTEGYLSRNNNASPLAKGLSLAKHWGLKHLPLWAQEKVFRSHASGIAQWMESSERFRGIQWDRTAAFSEELNYFPNIHINVCGREQSGTVPQGRAYETLRNEIIEKILTWKDPVTKTAIVKHAWKREELYQGPYIINAPDIILELNTPSQYSYVCMPYYYFSNSDETVKKLSPHELESSRLMSMSGSHRREGIFLFADEHLSPAQRTFEKIAIEDICPSILSFFGIPVAKDMDGQTLDFINIYHDGIQKVKTYGINKLPLITYTPCQEKKICSKLKKLGYID